MSDRDYQQKYYTEHRDSKKAQAAIGRRAWKSRVGAWLRKVKSRPCCDCDHSYPYYVMDFDHREGEKKVADINIMFKKQVAEKAIQMEVAKCDVVCANCHRERTHRRMQ